MYYGNIYHTSVVDGPGVRVSLYTSGCRNCCKGCHNPETWDFKYGKEYTEKTEKEILEAMNHDYIKGFTFSGGDPMEEETQRVLVGLVKKIKTLYPNKDIWSWTGYEYNDLIKGGTKYCEVTDELLSYIDVLVVGKFVLELRDIDMNETKKQGKVVMLKDIPNNEPYNN